jgi:hypothetical protein
MHIKYLFPALVKRDSCQFREQAKARLRGRPVPISPDKRACRLKGFCDDAKLPVREVPLKSRFEQVHWVSEFGGLNLVKTPFSRRRWSCSAKMTHITNHTEPFLHLYVVFNEI